MKFPKSVHAEGWDTHFDDAAPARTSTKPNLKTGFKSGAKPVTANTPLHGDPLPRSYAASAPTPVASPAYAQPVHAAAAPVARPAASRTAAAHSAPRSNATPWVIGVGVGALLIGGAVVMSRNTTRTEPAAPVVVGQASTSAEDAQLQAAPPSAGPVTPVPESTVTAAQAPAVTAPPPAAEPPRAVAAAPVEPRIHSPAVERAAPTAPVARTLSPAPEVLAQASPPPARLREPALQPLAPTVTPAPATPAPTVVPPETTAPVVPPVAQADTQPQPVVAVPEDSGITVKVRQALAADVTLAAVPIAVSTDHGVVKLEGQAPDSQTRERATVVASSATGVKAVDNRLTLPPPTVVSQAPTLQQ